MAAITLNDLPTNRALDRKAMSSIRGAGVQWGNPGLFRPYVRANPNLGPVVNFFQINNSYHADQMINQIQVVDINNSAANSNINVVLDADSANFKH